MASVASFIGDNSGTIATSGSNQRLYRYQQAGLYRSGGRLHHRRPLPYATNNAGATLNVDRVGQKTIQIYSGTSSLGGEIPAGSFQRLTYSSLSTGWILNGFRTSLGTIASSGSAASPTMTFQVDATSGLYLPNFQASWNSSRGRPNRRPIHLYRSFYRQRHRIVLPGRGRQRQLRRSFIQ